MTLAVFLDRDGVLIEDREEYVRSWDDVKFIPSAFDALKKLTKAELTLIIVTNQAAVGRGIVKQEFVEETHSRMLAEMELHGAKIAGVYYCPHRPDAGCSCRKPLPGLLIQASQDLGINLADSIMVGDSLRDIAAVEAAGGKGILVRTGKGGRECERLASGEGPVVSPIAIVSDIAEAAELILSLVPF